MDSSTPHLASPQKRLRSDHDGDDEDKSQTKVGRVTVGVEGSSFMSSPLAPSWQDLQESSDNDIGPAVPSSVPKKKRRVLPYEKLYISALPSSPRYSKSLMHKDQLSFVTMTPSTDFLITSSVDGVVKFWKKVAIGIEAVKEFKAHVGEIKSVSVSQDGRTFATAGIDKTIKIFDVITFGTCTDFVNSTLSKTGQIFSWYCNWITYQDRYVGSTAEALQYHFWQCQKTSVIQLAFMMAEVIRQNLSTRWLVFIVVR